MSKGMSCNVLQTVNIYKIKNFNYYFNKKKNLSYIGVITKASIKKQLITKKSKKRVNAIICQTKQTCLRKDGSTRKFNKNCSLVIKKNINPVSNRITGPTTLELARKKLLNYFISII